MVLCLLLLVVVVVVVVTKTQKNLEDLESRDLHAMDPQRVNRPPRVYLNAQVHA